jgi:arsenite methyltransferase
MIEGYHKEADLSLGCGIPTEIADIKEGDTVIDLGSGAGNDVFIARKIVGETGKVIGIDMTPEMVIRALQNNQKLGYKNVEFVLGEIENMQGIASNTADVVISNCVMNLVPDKEKAFKEVHRILKTNGHFSISDIVYSGYLPDGVFEAAEMYAGCVAGASEKGKYLGIIKAIGFKNIQIKKERLIDLPDELLLKYISIDELEKFRQSGSGVYSITIYADKLDEGKCCDTNENGCCGSDSTVTTENPDVAVPVQIKLVWVVVDKIRSLGHR